MSRKNITDRVLKNLSIVQFATPNNFSPFLCLKASTLNSSWNWPRKLFQRLLKDNKIRQIPLNGHSGKYTIKNTFFTLTHSGAKSIEARNYKYLGPKSIEQIRHTTGLIDIMLGFAYGFPEFKMEIDYKKVLTLDSGLKYTPDAYIRLTNVDNTYDFLVEFERSREGEEIKKEKFHKTENLNFKANGLSPKTKILFIFTVEGFDVFLRPVEYEARQKDIFTVARHFNKLLGVAGYLPTHKYRFTTLHQFTRCNQPVWITPRGNEVKLINN